MRDTTTSKMLVEIARQTLLCKLVVKYRQTRGTRGSQIWTKLHIASHAVHTRGMHQ